MGSKKENKENIKEIKKETFEVNYSETTFKIRT
jgi:hypothetical protein